VWPNPVLSTQPTSSLTNERTYEIQYVRFMWGAYVPLCVRGERAWVAACERVEDGGDCLDMMQLDAAMCGRLVGSSGWRELG
jgi:hypothetical protein